MTKRAETKQGYLRVWNIINPPSDPILYPVEDIEHARKLMDSLIESQLLDHRVHTNAFGLQVFEDGEWIEWSDEEGRDIDEHLAGGW